MSCCNCLTIQVIDIPEAVPSSFLNDDGKLYIDLDEDTFIEFSKVVSQLTDINEITDEAAYSITIPYSNKNDVLARSLRNHNTITKTWSPITVIVLEGPVSYTLDRLQISSTGDGIRRYEANLLRSAEHWIEAASKRFLNQIPLDTVPFTRDYITNEWQNNTRYDDGEIGAFWPMANYGRFLLRNNWVTEDIRPWFSVLYILQKGLCADNWAFRCPWLETDDGGRKLITYALSAGYGQKEERLAFEAFQAHIELTEILPGATNQPGWYISVIDGIRFEVVDYDPGGHYDPNTGNYNGGPIITDIYADLIVDWAVTDSYETPREFRAIIYLYNNDTQEILEVGDTEREVSPTETETGTKINVEAKNITIYPNQTAKVYIGISGGASIIQGIGGTFRNEPKRAIFQEGETLELGEHLNPKATLLKFFKGIVHLCNGKIKTDWPNREITLYTPYDSEYYGEEVEGFYIDGTYEDFTEKIVAYSERSIRATISPHRYVRLAFKEAKDEYIAEENLEEDDIPIFSKFIDLGDDIESRETTEVYNPIFEPTVNAVIDNFDTVLPELVSYEPSIPFLWDNKEGDLSFKLGFRLAFYKGYGPQKELQSGSNNTCTFRFNGNLWQNVPWAFMEPSGLRGDVNGDIPIERVIYGDDQINGYDFYNLGYRNEYNRAAVYARTSYRALLSAQDYKRLDFRTGLKIYYEGRTFVARLLELQTRRTCVDQPTIVVLRPETYGEDFCSDDITVINDGCFNAPAISISLDVKNDTVAATADDTGVISTIDTDTWYYSIDNGNTWLSYTPGTDISVNGARGVKFKRVTTYTDICPPTEVVRTVIWEAHCDDQPTIDVTRPQLTGPNNEVEGDVPAGEDFVSDVDTDTWQVSVDGGAFVAYTPGDTISNFTTVEFSRTVSFTNSCRDQTVKVLVDVDEDTPGEVCTGNAPEIILTEVVAGTCTYIPSIGGSVSSGICSVFYEVSRDSGVTWHSWDNQAIRSEAGTYVRAAVHFCDICPPIYLEKQCPF